jgi:tetratricopeptide (TPR) repeat protein
VSGSVSDALTAKSDTAVEPHDDPEYTAALAAFFTERWDEAVELLTRVLERYPDHSQAADRLTEARRQQQLTGWDADARQAAEQGRWAEAVEALEHLSADMPDVPDIAQRLKHARTKHEITSLQADLVRMHSAQQWSAAIAIGEQLAELDPSLADPDGLVTAAQAGLAEAALADHYRAGLLQLDRGDLVAAADTFTAIEAERPGYRDTAALLARARRDQPAQTDADPQPSPAQKVPDSPPRSEPPTPDQATIGESSRPASDRRRWLGISALATGGLAFVGGLFLAPGGPVVGLIVALLFLGGSLKLRSRPKIGAAVIGTFSAGWTVIAVIALSAEFDEPAHSLVFLSLLPALAAVVLSLREIRSP